ncbi:MAG: GNAT family N-acetyltransferase [Pseudomonadota bacterium]
MIQTFLDQAVFETDRLTLRPVRPSDAGLIGIYANDLRVAGPTRSVPHPLPPGAAEAFVEKAQKPDRLEDVWVMDGLKSNLPEVMGVVSLERLDRNQSKLGSWLAPAFWMQGYAREALQHILAANPQNNDAVFAEIFQDNARSAKILTDNGFAYLGEAEAYCVARHKTIDTWTYSKRMI